MTDDLVLALRASDPDRHAMAMLAPPSARARLVTLYALNLELARAPLGARDPVLAQMRVQWWIDHLSAMDRAPPPAHVLLQVLHAAWGEEAAELAALAQGRVRDAERQPFETAEALRRYVDATAGVLMRLAARAVEMPDDAHAIVAAQATGAGLSAWLAAEPALTALNLGLQDPSGRADLAQTGLAAFRSAAQGRRAVPRRLGVVLYPGPAAGQRLQQVARGQAPAAPSDFVRRLGIARLAIAGRWWVGR